VYRKTNLLLATHVLFIVCVFFAPAVLGQVATADLVGQVTDSSRAVISGVTVTVDNASTGLVRKTATDESGNWTIPALPIGAYRLRAEHAGFKAAAVSDIVLAAADRRRVDIALELGAVEQSVDVTALAPALQSDSSRVLGLENLM